jgi:hypothetical protein
MTLRMALERNTATGTDAHNQPVVASYSPHVTIPCLAWETMNRHRVEGGESAMVEDFRAIVPDGSDVTERDRVASIADRRGVVKFPGPIRIETVQRTLEGTTPHLELSLKKVAS